MLLIAIYSDNHTKTYKYKTQHYRLFRQLGHVITTKL
jgi:hypothetical protein